MKFSSRDVNDLLRQKSMALHNVIKSNLLDITMHLYSEGLIAKAIYEKVVKGVTGLDTAQLSAEVALAVNDRLAMYPDDCLKYIAVIKGFDASLAKKMEQKFEGELTCFEQNLFSAMWHSHLLNAMIFTVCVRMI